MLLVEAVVELLDVDVGSSEIELTLPAMTVVAPSAVTAVRCPTFTFGNDVSGTSTVIRVDPLPTMTIESEVLASWPLTRSVEAIVPEIGAVSVAAARFASAVVTEACALVTVTLSWATRAAAEVADPADGDSPELEPPELEPPDVVPPDVDPPDDPREVVPPELPVDPDDEVMAGAARAFARAA